MSLALLRATAALRDGEVIAYPTEGVWGLGCDPLNADAAAQLLWMKRRSPAKGLILIAADFSQLAPYLAAVPEDQLELARSTWPGPVTWLFPVSADCPRWVSGEHATVAVRVSAHPGVAALCRHFGGALISTSANRSGHPTLRSALQIRRHWGAELGYIYPGALGGRDRPSQIRNLADGRVLR